MAENDNGMMFEILKRIQSEIAGNSRRFDRIETHLGNLERRQTASTHFEQSVLAHFAAIHEGLDDLRSEMRDVLSRLDRVESR